MAARGGGVLKDETHKRVEGVNNRGGKERPSVVGETGNGSQARGFVSFPKELKGRASLTQQRALTID